MNSLPVVFACAHLCNEELFAPQLRTLREIASCTLVTFRTQTSIAAMAEHLLVNAPPRFVLVGLSLGGYVAFEVLRQARERVAGLALLDTRADADDPTRTANRHRDIETVARDGIDALIPELPARWMHPTSAADPELCATLAGMARDIGAKGQRNQQLAMLARGDSFEALRAVTVPTLILCGRQDMATPLSEHERMHATIALSELHVIENCGHLSTIEQPEAVTSILRQWLTTSPFTL